MIYTDFHNTDELGRVRLNTIGSIEDLMVEGITLCDGLCIIISDGELEANGIVRYSEEGWVVEVDWDAIV